MKALSICFYSLYQMSMELIRIQVQIVLFILKAGVNNLKFFNDFFRSLTIFQKTSTVRSKHIDPNHKDDHIDLEIQEDMLVILSLVADINQKEMLNSNLIPILVYYLRTLPGRVVNGVRRQQLLLSVLDCIFSAVLGMV